MTQVPRVPPPKLRGWAEGFIEKSKTNNMVIIYHTMKTQINLLCSGGAPPPFLSPAANHWGHRRDPPPTPG